MTKTVSIRVDKTLLDAVDAAGVADRRGRSEVFRQALELWLRHRVLEQQVQQHREGYRRYPVTSEEFSSVLGAQTWPK